MDQSLLDAAKHAAAHFRLEGETASIEPYGNGHINDTFLVTNNHSSHHRYILQRINRRVFLHPEQVMENIAGVTRHLRDKMAVMGPQPDMRDVLTLIYTTGGMPYYIDEDGGFWRVYVFVEHTVSYEKLTSTEMFAYSARSFGTLFTLLADYPAHTLHETIPNFHNTPMRCRQLEEAVATDARGRVAKVETELAFVRARRAETGALHDAWKAGALPTRVTHNDTKLNNVLLDDKTGRGACVIDLDTVMPGVAAYDFGDSIRFGASTCVEDETDLSLCGFSLPMYQAYAEGFLATAGEKLTPAEVRSLPMGAKLMTFECGVRFLADYLNGDVYFKTAREAHNLDRARTQFCLVASMEANWPAMQAPLEGWLAAHAANG